MNKKQLKVFVALVIGCVLTLCISSCGKSEEEVKLNDEQISQIMEQYVEDEELTASAYLPDKWFVSYNIFEVIEAEDYTEVYAYVESGEFVSYKGRGYELAGSSLPVKLTLDKDSLKITKVEFPEDGSGYVSSLKKLFPKNVYKECNKFDPMKLTKDIKKQVESQWDVDVDDNYQLSVDEKGNYEVTVIDNDGSDGAENFQCHIEEKGQLEPLK